MQLEVHCNKNFSLGSILVEFVKCSNAFVSTVLGQASVNSGAIVEAKQVLDLWLGA